MMGYNMGGWAARGGGGRGETRGSVLGRKEGERRMALIYSEDVRGEGRRCEPES